MIFPNYRWHSLQGSLTSDNRDVCGIAELHGTCLFILVDGATTGPKGGELAKTLVGHLLESFVSLERPPSCEVLIEILHTHTDLRRQYPADSASYIIALQEDPPSVTTLHAGNCRLGRPSPGGSIQWLTKVHTLANAIDGLADPELRVHPDRHLLTRSFKSRRFDTPECNVFDLQDGGGSLLLASDGFWADLTEDEQLSLLQMKRLRPRRAGKPL